jgi:salicylate hydroxylase
VEPLLVVGGGIGGLAAAIALRQAGFAVRVFERTPAFAEAGAGLTVTAPGLRALDALGVLAEVLEASDSAASTAFIHYQTGELLKISPPPPADINRDPTRQTRIMHRSDMQSILLRAARSAGAELDAGCELADFKQNGDGVELRFQSGRIERGAALIGADGLRSLTRGRLRGDGAPRYTGIVAWRCLVPVASVEPLLGGHASAVHIGPDATFVRYQVRHGAVLNCVATVRTPSMASDSWSTPSDRAELAAQFPAWHSELHALIAALPDSGIFKWPVFERDLIEDWADRRVALLGDAAHPMLPFLGIGATLALEDAVLLGQSLGEQPDLAAALRQYAARRVPRVAVVSAASRLQGERILGRAAVEEYRKPGIPLDLFDYDPRPAGALCRPAHME